MKSTGCSLIVAGLAGMVCLLYVEWEIRPYLPRSPDSHWLVAWTSLGLIGLGALLMVIGRRR